MEAGAHRHEKCRPTCERGAVFIEAIAVQIRGSGYEVAEKHEREARAI